MKKTKNITIKPKTLRLKSSVQKPIIRVVDLTKIFNRDPFAKLLKDQNVISWLLFWVIRDSAGFSDGRFIQWLERKTLGELIQIFKGIARPFRSKVFRMYRPEGYTMKELINYLEGYNKKRNVIFHELVKEEFETEDEILKLAKETNKKGETIIAMLGKLFQEKINQNLQKVKEKLNKIEKLNKG